MLKMMRQDSQNEIEKCLADMGIDKKIYQICEVIFLHAMIQSGFKYDGIESDKRLFDRNLPPRDRVNICEEFIGKWIKNNPEKNFGFYHIEVNEYIEGITALELVRSVRDQISTITSESHDFLYSDESRKLHKTLKSVLLKLTEINLEDFDKTDYFTRYLGFYRAVFYPIIEGRKGVSRNKFNEFVAKKIVLEHFQEKPTNNQTLASKFDHLSKSFTKNVIKQRLGGGADTYKKLKKDIESKYCLLGKPSLKADDVYDFHEYLLNQFDPTKLIREVILPFARRSS